MIRPPLGNILDSAVDVREHINAMEHYANWLEDEVTRLEGARASEELAKRNNWDALRRTEQALSDKQKELNALQEKVVTYKPNLTAIARNLVHWLKNPTADRYEWPLMTSHGMLRFFVERIPELEETKANLPSAGFNGAQLSYIESMIDAKIRGLSL